MFEVCLGSILSAIHKLVLFFQGGASKVMGLLPAVEIKPSM